MKQIVTLIAAVLTAAAAWAWDMPKAPAFLHPGDRIALISLGSTPQNNNPALAAATLRKWGFDVVVGRHALDRHRCYAGTARERADDLLRALRDPRVKAIVSTRGGYGTSQVLEYVPLDTLRKYPKWIVGYSDITAMHSAQVCAGNMSLHANMGGALGEFGPDNAINLMLRDILMGQLPAYEVPGNRHNLPGTAHGVLVGGNMAVFSNIAGSQDYDFLDRDQIRGRDIILFFEDVSENMARVNSMLSQLKLKGVISQVKAVIVGRFTDYKPAYGYADMNEMLSEYLQGYDIPICYDFPVSHDETWNYPMIEGCPVTLNVTTSKVTLTYDLAR